MQCLVQLEQELLAEGDIAHRVLVILERLARLGPSRFKEGKPGEGVVSRRRSGNQ